MDGGETELSSPVDQAASGVYQTVDTVWYTPLAFDLVGQFTQRLGSKRWDRTTRPVTVKVVQGGTSEG